MVSLPRKERIQQPYHPDIDGLRAIAVLAVVCYHFFPHWLRGGFIGVDIFFVISGYLISTVIFQNLAHGSFSFTDFYCRRILRIFPALILVLSFCLVVGWFVLLGEEYRYLGKHVTGGSVFISNFLLWNESGYFDKSANEKLLLHLWSLGIEEQFYLIWPVALWLAWRFKQNAFFIILVLMGISFFLNLRMTQLDPVAAFFSPQTRFWELLAGAGLAYVNYQNSTIQRIKNDDLIQNLCSVVGLLFIIFGFLLIRPDRQFPGGWALLPVLGSAFLMYANKSWFNAHVLSNRALVLIGKISFPLYLWHWPLLVYSDILLGGQASPMHRILLVLIAFLLAWLTYFFIENPIRTGIRSMRSALVLLLTMVLVGLAGFMVYINHGLQFRSAVTHFSQAEDAFLWPEEWNVQEACIKKYPFYGRYCLESDPLRPPSVALIGDSHANQLYIGLADYYQKKGENLINLGGWLPFWNVENGSLSEQSRRVERREWMEKILNEVSASPTIETIILAFRENAVNNTARAYSPYTNYWKLINHPNLTDEKDMLYIALRETMAKLIQTNKKIILIADIPGLDFNPKECISQRPFVSHRNTREVCGIERSKFEAYTEPYHAIIKKISEEFPAVHIFYSYHYLCDDKYCYAKKDNDFLYRDDNHLSYNGSLYVGKQLIKEMHLLQK